MNSGGSDLEKNPLPNIFPGIPHPIHPADPKNQFQYSNESNRKSKIVEYNAKNPERNLQIPESMNLG